MEQRIFFPGSDWLYFKIYTSYRYADNLLITTILNFTNKLLKKDRIDKWFFIRYSDPEPHIRLRLKLKSPINFTYILNLFSEEFKYELSNGYIWKIKIDTYKRELERYGVERMNDVESIFHIDSVCIVNLLKNISGISDKENIRWQLGFLLIDSLFDSFAYNINDRNHIMKIISTSFSKEFGFVSAAYTKQLNDKYRESRVLIEQILNRSYDQMMIYFPIIREHKTAIEKIVADMEKNALDNLLTSLIHMSMNRLFMSDNRTNEMVIYYLLSKFYSSYKAQQENNKINVDL